ncbi:hypothetical protein JI435_308330 [Parastagonospora nodorum SN15]|uniref:Uncharacterized protein n=1 Tax=Phaeosphaeria nodorum (strain SN15 / ATCC MYA-4574 / FGSC 10173) TaxID=321614 RepID=A0A7U2ICF9_PHANO|nr:hypothetical protein HBI09_147370 [Parastagonospora nodorum]QRD07130.1 hypothetical protein JI435_308330 [Parastagonospora nodorum SN15]KAH4124805.1 hypothetical protein HBH45_233380 [Parastagonospora nodorum]KAH4148104.1 hypothetical protein HBH44_214240 [Parastagonospora nodorum]KAH4182411.1 hypothetical protein HBH42_221370 [Parastagonospora nodorum]
MLQQHDTPIACETLASSLPPKLGACLTLAPSLGSLFFIGSMTIPFGSAAAALVSTVGSLRVKFTCLDARSEASRGRSLQAQSSQLATTSIDSGTGGAEKLRSR